jgi:hypothetical protein
VELDSLGADDFVRILKEPKAALTRQYKEMLAAEGIEIDFTDKAIEKSPRSPRWTRWTRYRMAGTNDPMHYWGRWVDRLVRTDEGWLFAEREVVGIGSIEPNDAGQDRAQPGHPGRLKR